MTVSARYSAANHSSYSRYDEEIAGAHWELVAGERVGGPPARRIGKLLFRGVLLLLTLGAGGWAALDRHSMWTFVSGWSSAIVDMAMTGPSRDHPRSDAHPAPAAQVPLEERPAIAERKTPEPVAGAETKPQPSEPTAVIETHVPEPDRDEASPKPEIVAVAPSPEKKDEPAEPLPPPVATDAYQKRAVAVGLHPDLSRALLERLSEADYRNARIAVRTALAKTPDEAVFVWPKQAKPPLAQYQVHFVPGAAAGCRRYVVTVAKGGWLTTALPMENCEVKRRSASAR